MILPDFMVGFFYGDLVRIKQPYMPEDLQYSLGIVKEVNYEWDTVSVLVKFEDGKEYIFFPYMLDKPGVDVV